MALTQKFGIVYPFTSENIDELYLDLNAEYEDSIKSQVLHVLFTPKGQKIRDPEFGTNLIKYIFQPADDTTYNELTAELTESIRKYVPGVTFRDISIYEDEKDEHGKIVVVTYTVTKGTSTEETKVAVRI